ncbi:MAG: hypothetical protein WCK17_06530 [Verrucomicrobiota bacterium]
MQKHINSLVTEHRRSECLDRRANGPDPSQPGHSRVLRGHRPRNSATTSRRAESPIHWRMMARDGTGFQPFCPFCPWVPWTLPKAGMGRAFGARAWNEFRAV